MAARNLPQQPSGATMARMWASRVLVMLCLGTALWGAGMPGMARADEPVPGVVLQGATIKDDRGKPFKLRRGDKLTVLSVQGDRAHVATQGRTAWVPVKLLLIATPKGGKTPTTEEPSSNGNTSSSGGSSSGGASTDPPRGTPAATPITLAVTSEPAGAVITVDGNAMGVTPLAATPVGRGSHRVELTLDGYDAQVQDVTVRGEVAVFMALRPKMVAAAPSAAGTCPPVPAAVPCKETPAATSSPAASPTPSSEGKPAEATPAATETPAAEEASPRRFWPRVVAPVPVIFFGLLSTVLMAVGVGGAVLWVASANAILLQSTGFKFKDDLSNTIAANVARREILLGAVVLTAGAPVLALLLGALGAFVALGIMNL